MKHIKSKRLILTPMTNGELEEIAQGEADPHLKAAYREMLEGCVRQPEDHLFFTEWRIALKNGTPVGGLGFKGPQRLGEMEIGYGVDEQYRGCGYAAEAVTALVRWAFSQKGVYFVTAQAEAENLASLRVLEKAGFVPAGEGEEGLLFEREKPRLSWSGVCMLLGLGCGIAIGSAFSNPALGMCIGAASGLGLGWGLDAAGKRKRELLRARRLPPIQR